MDKKNSHENIDSAKEAGRREIIFYADPLCCWSYILQLQLEKLQQEHGMKLPIRYCMVGMIESWERYYDEQNSVSKPLQMGPVWAQAGSVSGVALYDRLWYEDPPASSYLACIAVKCVSLQAPELEGKYLALLWDAMMRQGINMAGQNRLQEIAGKLAETYPGKLDIAAFNAGMVNGTGAEAFKSDLQEIRYKNITRFPTMVIKEERKGKIITGYRPYDVLKKDMEELLATGIV